LPNPISINLNFDSLSEAFGFPSNFRDPSFFEGVDRFFAILDAHGVKSSIYVIGRDLENPAIFQRVREWAENGHEIGNHTWSHPMNLGGMSQNDIRQQIYRCHEIVTNCTGVEPKGFIAPAWSTSSRVVDCLIDMHYQYDTSLFPSFLLYPMVMKIFLNHINQPNRLMEIIGRRDWMNPFIARKNPGYVYHSKGKQSGRLLQLPMPILNRFQPPFWHTIGFLFGWNYSNKLLDKILAKDDFFYYLLHPADFLGLEDVGNYQHSLERLDQPLNEKLAKLEDGIEKIVNTGRPVVLMKDVEGMMFPKNLQNV